MTLIKRLVNSNLITRLNNIKTLNQVSTLQKKTFSNQRGYVI